MKFRLVTLSLGILIAGMVTAQQTMTDVINEFNAGVENINGQSYETALVQFNNCLALCDVVGDSAVDMKKQAQDQVVGAHYRQAITLMKRKQYDKALPPFENTVAFSEEYQTKAELATKANKYLPSLYLREGNVLLKQEKFQEACAIFDKVLEMNPNNYKAHQGKGLVQKEMGEIDNMMSEFSIAKEKATVKGDEKFIAGINAAIDDYYRGLIEEELMMMDEEDPDFTFLIDICDQAIAANDKNGYARWQAASASNKTVEYDSAIEYAAKGVEYESDPILLSALYYELGQSYQGNVMYQEACEAYNMVTDEPFFTKAEKKLMTPELGCSSN
jgi:tetratricopeptide (TPR) repeat protein